jgi:hypothetical protein
MANKDSRQGYAIPPNRAAVAAAMTTTKRRPKGAMTMVCLFILGGLGVFFLPMLSKGLSSPKQKPVISKIDPVYGEARVHADTFRLLIDLPSTREGGRSIELAGDLTFSYAADYDDWDAADAAIRAHWEQAATKMVSMVAAHTRLEHIRNRAEIFDNMREALDGIFFPKGSGKVIELDWAGKLSLH